MMVFPNSKDCHHQLYIDDFSTWYLCCAAKVLAEVVPNSMLPVRPLVSFFNEATNECIWWRNVNPLRRAWLHCLIAVFYAVCFVVVACRQSQNQNPGFFINPDKGPNKTHNPFAAIQFSTGSYERENLCDRKFCGGHTIFFLPPTTKQHCVLWKVESDIRERFWVGRHGVRGAPR